MEIKKKEKEAAKAATEMKPAGEKKTESPQEQVITEGAPKEKVVSQEKVSSSEKASKSEEKTKEPNVSKTIEISIDNSPEDVIKYNNDGVKLLFAHEKGRFLRLPSEVARDLSHDNKQRYFVSKGMHEETLSFDHYDQRKFPPRPGFATATDRLEVRNQDPSKHYCWKRPDELRQAQMEGYRVANDPSLDTFGSETGTSRTVGEQGQDELVLMEIPNEKREQQRAANRDKDHQRRKGVESSAMDDMIRSGGKPYIPKED